MSAFAKCLRASISSMKPRYRPSQSLSFHAAAAEAVASSRSIGEWVMVVGRVSIGMPQRADTAALMRHAPSSFRHVVATQSIGVGSVVVPPGALGVAFDLSQDEIEVEFYSPKHVIAYASLSQLAIT